MGKSIAGELSFMASLALFKYALLQSAFNSLSAQKVILQPFVRGKLIICMLVEGIGLKH